ncbi:hypothetical protein FG386_000579 [Cryptosporidium ryanae]|uniref:uncharacterized protein n=1 Tax=Cryptosporidium ryanae TaxID=515981 RepID=UPI00351A2F03|nr:hypothetical protein FG386_000579 [Cryptosporidium ryanae]
MNKKESQNGSNSQFTQRDQQQFKNIVQLYDQRIYKKALKLTDVMLKKYPKQSDLLSMKAFIMGALHSDANDSRHKEAYEYAKEAIKMNVKNPMSWHCLGTLYRSDFDYFEAIKCFKTALKFDKEDAVVLRDLGTCYIQIRNYEGFREMRNEIKRIRPDIRVNWIASALGNHLCGYINSALNSLVYMDKLATCEGDLSKTKNKEGKNVDEHDKSQRVSEYGRLFSFLDPFQRSELLLYFVKVLLDGKKYQQAYDFLIYNEDYILDKTDYYTILGNLLLKCGLNYSNECRHCFSQLLKLYPDDDFSIIGCMLSDESLKGIVLPPSSKIMFELKTSSNGGGDSLKRDHSISYEDGVVPLISVSCNFYQKRGTSGIMYYPIFGVRDEGEASNLCEYIGRNKYIKERKFKLSSMYTDSCSYGKKRPAFVNDVLETIVHSSEYLEERKEYYDKSIKLLVDFFDKKKKEYPKSDSILRIEMGVLDANSFSVRFRDYILNRLNNRINNLTSLLTFISKLDSNKKLIFDRELTNIVGEFENKLKNSETSKEKMVILYNIYSQHLDSMGKALDGLEYIEKSLNLESNRPDTHLIKRRLLKHLYRLDDSLESMENAKKLDSNDRYLNIKLICSYLESGNMEKANRYFADMMNSNLIASNKQKSREKDRNYDGKEDVPDIRNLQVIWFEKRRAYYSEIYESDNQLLVLENYQKVMDSLEIMRNDQYDYHLYCLRKMTLNRYIEFLGMHDKICSSKQYRESGLMYWRRIWIYMHNHIKLNDNDTKKRVKGENERERKHVLDFIDNLDLCWKKSHDIVLNFRKDCVFNVNSYLVIYTHYYCSYKLTKKISLGTCLLICVQAIYRLYAIEKQLLSSEQVGSYLVLLAHFSSKLLKELILEYNGCLEKHESFNGCGKTIIECILKQFEAISGLKSNDLDEYLLNVNGYINDILCKKANLLNVGVNSLINIVKISILNQSFNKVEDYLDNRDNYLNFNLNSESYYGLFKSDKLISLTKLLYLRSMFAINKDDEFEMVNSCILVEGNEECLFQVIENTNKNGSYRYSLKHFSDKKSNFLNRIVLSYDLNNKSFCEESNNISENSFIKNKYVKKVISSGVYDLINIPILSLTL